MLHYYSNKRLEADNIIAANLHIWRPTPASATQGTHHAMQTGTQGGMTFRTLPLITNVYS